jgi:hypothetical protein
MVKERRENNSGGANVTAGFNQSPFTFLEPAASTSQTFRRIELAAMKALRIAHQQKILTFAFSSEIC